jgi:hypothetical protein
LDYYLNDCINNQIIFNNDNQIDRQNKFHFLLIIGFLFLSLGVDTNLKRDCFLCLDSRIALFKQLDSWYCFIFYLIYFG